VGKGRAARNLYQVTVIEDAGWNPAGKGHPGCLKHRASGVLFLLKMFDLPSLSQLTHFCKSHSFSGPCFPPL